MLNRKNAILAGAVLAAIPMVGKAATITFQYSPNDITVNGVITALGGTTSAPTLTVPLGAVIDIGAQVVVTSNSNPASGDAYDTTAGHSGFQPVNLGLSAFGFGFNTSNSTVAAFDGQDDGSASTGETINTNEFKNASGTGLINAAGNISQPSVSGGLTVASVSATTAANGALLGFGANGTPGELFSNLQIDAGSANGSATITSLNALASNAYAAYNSGGTTSAAKPVYKSVTTTGADVVNNLPTLTIIVGSAITGSTTHPIISLISSSSTPASGYGNGDGTITMTGKGNGSYNVSIPSGFTAATTGGIDVKGFNPTSDTEVYALKLTTNGGALTGAQISTVIADINGTGTNTTAAAGVTASNVSGSAFSSIFAGYQILLTSTAGITDDAELNFDFSSAGDTDSSVPGLVLTGVAAVPEPATAAGVVLGAAGLLLGRRRNRLTVA
jgi:hypothetical protein